MTFDYSHNCLAYAVGVTNRKIWFNNRRQFDRFFYRCGFKPTKELHKAKIVLFFGRRGGELRPFHVIRKDALGSWSHKPGPLPVVAGLYFEQLRLIYGHTYRMYQTYV